MCWTDMDVLRCSSLSSSNFFLVILRAACIGTEVNRASTSYDTRHSFGFNLMSWMLSMKSFAFFTWYSVLPTKGFNILESSLAVSYDTEPTLDTIGLNGVSSLCRMQQVTILIEGLVVPTQPSQTSPI